MASREDIERMLQAAKDRAKARANGRPGGRRIPERLRQSMCVIGSRSGFARRPGRPYTEPEVRATCGKDAPSLEEANAMASAARWRTLPPERRAPVASKTSTEETPVARPKPTVRRKPPVRLAKAKPAEPKVTPVKATPKAKPKPKVEDGPPVRMDHVLRDLKDAAEAKGGYVERKHVAKALRGMLDARRLGFSVRTPNHSFASTLDITDTGGGRMSAAQEAALRSLFGEDASGTYTFMVLVTPFVGQSDSVPTGIVPSRIEAFRRAVAKAAGLSVPGPFDPTAKRGRSKPSRLPAVRAVASVDNVTTAPASADRMDDAKVLTLLEAFVDMVNTTEAPEHPLRLRTTETAMVVMAGPLGARESILSVRTSPQGFTVAQGADPRLAELFLNTFAGPMRGRARARTETTRSFAWAPKAEQGRRWAKTMSDLAPRVPRTSTTPTPAHSTETTAKTLGIGRADHDARREARVTRLRSRADKARAEADTRFKAAGQGLPPFGEPIKIGHHSETRHRRALERAQAHGFKGLEASRAAKRLDARADAAEDNTAISSDDPRALERLRAKLAQMETLREETKRKNRLARQGTLPDAENPMNPASVWEIAGKRKHPTPGYVLKNLGAEIRRVRERIETLSKREGRAARSLTRGDVEVVENGDLNRVQVFTGTKPPTENRTWLKRRGFRWARSEGAWQRTLGDDAWNAAMEYLDAFVEKRDDTPFARLEAPAPKPTFNERDVEFWSEEFARLDGEFRGDFDDAMLEAVEAALRARKSGHPRAQARAYGRIRTGSTLLEALEELYRYGRYERPKPRPKRARKTATSSMTLEAFIDAVREQAAAFGGQLFASKARLGVHFNHYNVPKDSTDGTLRENNRLMLSLHGWQPGGGPPKDGTVKLTIGVAMGMTGVRGRTTTPEVMVDVVVAMLRRHSALETR